MGIPHYYKHIISTYKTILKNNPPKCDRFYIDFNSIIHQCAAEVVQTLPSYTHANIIDNIIGHTEKLISHVQPSELVFIGVDGVAPRAKMVQQRKRRYISTYKNAIIKEAYQRQMLPLPPDWDSNIITPGTPFMLQLDKSIESHFSKKNTAYKVIISGSNIPGEGEQKLFDHMKRTAKDDKINIINGLDADLIMLSLLSQHTVFLQRDFQTYVDINEFRDCISYHVNPEKPTFNLMLDYVFLCFLLGNDFVPNVPFLKIRNAGVDILLSIYKEVSGNFSSNLVKKEEEYTVDIDMLKNIMLKLAEMEQENMEYAMKQYNDVDTVRNFVNNIPDDCPRSLKKFMIELEQYPLKHRHPLSTHQNGNMQWNALYYQEFFGSHDPVLIKRNCEHFVDGLLWVLNYYFNRKYDNFWYYKYHVSPLCSDIYKSMLMMDASSIQKDISRLQRDSLNIKISPELQLLCVIPVSSKNILPGGLSKIMQDPKHGCVHYFPTEFKLCTFMKRFLWECSPILPNIDIEHLNNVLKQSRRAPVRS